MNRFLAKFHVLLAIVFMAAIGFGWVFNAGRVQAAVGTPPASAEVTSGENGTAMPQPLTQPVVFVIAALAGSLFGAMALLPLLRVDVEQPSQGEQEMRTNINHF